MSQLTALSFEPRHISVSKSKGIGIEWSDSHHSQYELQYLRDHCPCAGCTGAHGDAPAPQPASSPLQLYKPKLKIESIEPVGNYAIRIRWNDGHNTGIYSYEYFRRICPCEACRSLSGEDVER